jgi:hypothetical protein
MYTRHRVMIGKQHIQNRPLVDAYEYIYQCICGHVYNDIDIYMIPMHPTKLMYFKL